MGRIIIGIILIVFFFFGILGALSDKEQSDIGATLIGGTIVFLIPGVLLIYFGWRSRSQSSGKAYQSLSLSDLQKAVPKWKVNVTLSSGTIFGNKTVVWFEKLLHRTFEEPAEFEKDFVFLCREYVRLLEGLQKLLDCWEYVWKDSGFDPTKTAVLTSQKYGIYTLRLKDTLEWLNKMVTEEERLMAARPDAAKFPAWNRQIFSMQYSSPLTDSASGLWQQYQLVVETPCNPVVLDEEVRRLSEFVAHSALQKPI